ncbi:MAG: peptidylprolyl isomerase [Candidatus Poribacteria bacterium]|nr:peptidylprolyl isomerase [Candidatus Poribacteria bacterium]
MAFRTALHILFVIACLLGFPIQSIIAQEAQSVAPPASEESTDQTQEVGSGSERLNPETDVPGEGMIIGDGDDMAMVGHFVQIHGNALIKFEDVILRADHIWADFDDNLMRASGNVHLKIGNEETYSDELIFNLDNKKGIARNGFTFSDPWYFGGSEIFKIQENRSYIRGASLTTCTLKHPHYHFSVSEVIVQKDQEMIAKNIVLRIGGFPLFYFPVIRRDIRKGKIAKIIVKIGTDSYQGPNISIILPVARKRRYDGALLYDRSSKRGQGFGFEGKYRFNDTQFQEIYIPIPPDVTPNQRTKLKEKADELQDRLDGEYDRYWLRQIFIEYKITEEDVKRASDKAEEVLGQLQEEGADFSQIAQNNSDHFDTRYDGGDMGFLVPGEIDEEGKPKLDPILEEALFALQEGEISPIVQTESAFHILKAERVLDVYGEREIKLRRIDIAITASEDTESVLRELADDMLKRAHEGEPFEQLIHVPEQFAELAEPTLSEPNEGNGLLLNEMESSWRSAVRRLENPGDVIERRPITMPEGLYIFQLIEKEETPTFEALAEQFEAEWDTFYDDVMNPKPEETEGDGDSQDIEAGESQDAMEEEVSDKQSEVSSPSEIESSPGTESEIENHRQEADGDTPDTDEDQTVEQDESEREVEGETTAEPSDDDTTSEDAAEEEDAEEEEDELKVYRKHGFRGRWEDPSAVASDAQRLYAGEYSSRPIQTKKSFRLIKVDKKRTYRGDIYFYGADRYSYERQNATRIGRRWIMRWGHTQSFYTPWDSRAEGRRPINFTGRTELQARNFKEELKLPGESRLNTFGILTYGTGLSTVSDNDRDENGNLTFSRETIGDITGRLEVRHVHDFTGEGTTSLQKLPQFTVNFSRMRVSALPLLGRLNDRMESVAEKFKTETPILSLFTLPTLESTSFDLDVELGNFFREVYKGKEGDERDVYLQTLDLGFDVRKQSTLLITPLRELQMSLDVNTNMIWHDQDQQKNRNILKGVYSFNGSATNTLFRVFNVGYIPGLRKLRHEIQSSLRFNYQPAVDEDENLYPFGPSTYFYERKRLTYNFNTNFEIKTRRSQSAHRIFYFDTRLTADFTEFDPLYRRKYEPIESDFTFVPLPSRNLNMTVRFTHDPNPHPDDGKQFKMVGFRTNIRYTRPAWNVSIGNSFSKRHTSRSASRSLTATGRYRFSQDLEFDVSLIYYPIEGQFYSQRISMTRNLHDWNLRISWNRVGIKREDSPYNNVRQDFTFQVNLIQEPAVSMGVGYDATTETWGLHTLPAGAPYNAFGSGSSLGRSYF